MTIIGEFCVSTELFALQETLTTVPDAVIEIERVVATDDILTPYFWVSGCNLSAFEAAAEADPSIRDLQQLDTYEAMALYRADWTDQTKAIAFAYARVDAVIEDATGQNGEWELRIRFDDHRSVEQFRDYCRENDIPFELERLTDESADRPGAKFGLTEKQSDALMTAWELGYFEEPRRVTLADVASELSISKQSVARRLRRGHQTMIGNALEVTPPTDEQPPSF